MIFIKTILLYLHILIILLLLLIKINFEIYNNNIFLVQQKDGSWNIPGGHIDSGENSFQAAFREFKEETDFKDEDFIVLDKITPIIEDFIGSSR